MLGVLSVFRPETNAFSNEQVRLLEAFARQAAIAIENARLFNELEERNREITEALERERAMSRILEVISSSPAAIQPVFEAVVAEAGRLTGAQSTGVLLARDGQLVPVASDGAPFEVPIARTTAAGRAFLDHAPEYIEDYEADGDTALLAEYEGRYPKTVVAVPLVRQGVAIGVITQGSTDTVRPISPKQIAMLETFADQAVIAMENARLFNELEERNSELATSLERQTATSEIMEVVGTSTADAEPVLDSIVEHAGELFQADAAVILRIEGDELIPLAGYNRIIPWTAKGNRFPLSDMAGSARTLTEGLATRSVHSRDEYVKEFSKNRATERLDAAFPDGWNLAQLFVPLLSSARVDGVIVVSRSEGGTAVPRPFSDQEQALAETFARQAVIALENARLFNELEERTEELTASAEVLAIVSDFSAELPDVMRRHTREGAGVERGRPWCRLPSGRGNATF